MHFFETLVIAREHSRFRKLLKSGLRARDVVPVKILGEKKERLALLCEGKKQVFAVICVSDTKTDFASIFTLLGSYLQASEGLIFDKRSDWVELSGAYEGLRAPVIIARNVTKKVPTSC